VGVPVNACDEVEVCRYDRACPFYSECCYEHEPKTPPYVHALLDAFLTGEPLNFGREWVPEDVQARLTEAVSGGMLGQAHADDHAT
jgi:hypothetical protein